MIPEIAPYNNYTGDGKAVQFDFDFYIKDGSQLKVVYINEDGITYELVENIDYSIKEVGNENGSYITFPLAGSTYSVLASGEVISLQLTLPFSQESEYGMSSELNLKSLEYSFDYLTRLSQILNRNLERAVKVEEGSSTTPDDLMVEINNSAKAASKSATMASASATRAKELLEEVEQQEQKALDAITAAYDEAMKSISNAGLPTSICTKLKINKDGLSTTLKWRDPDDTIIDGLTLCTWRYTLILRKKGAYPENELDGEVILKNDVKNAYTVIGYTDTPDSDEYFYRAFPVSANGVVNYDVHNKFGGELYEFIINPKDSNPATCVEYSGENIGL